MVKERYKEVRVGPQKEIIPKNWEVKALSDIGKFINGKGFSSSDWEEDGLPIVRIQNLNDEEAEYNYYSEDVKDRYYLKNGDILLSWSASLGAYKWKRGNAILNQHIFKVLPKDNIDKEFMYQLLLVTIDKLEQKTHGSTMKHIRRKELDLTFFPLPPLPEQKKIASILSSVDKTIEKTDEVIEKTKELKKGLMQQLLTKGIGHSDFKEVRIGAKTFFIPKEWTVNSLSKLSDLQGGYAFKSKNYVQSGLKLLKIQNVQRKNINWEDVSYLPSKYLDKNEKYILSKDDIVIAMTRPIISSGLKVARIKENDILLNQRVGKFNIKNEVNSDFMYQYFLSKIFTDEIDKMLSTTNQPNISRKKILSINIIVPPLEEQKKIASILSSVDKKIKKEEEYKAKLERLKKGLMQKLLTGEIRVNTESEV